MDESKTDAKRSGKNTNSRSYDANDYSSADSEGNPETSKYNQKQARALAEQIS